MKSHHSVKLISDFATTLGLILALALYGIGVQWVFENAPWVLAWYLIASIPATFIVIAALRVGGDS